MIWEAKTLKEAKEIRSFIYAQMSNVKEVLSRFPKLSNGLHPDEVKRLPDYQAASDESKRLFAKLRDFNSWYTKTFKAELKQERAQIRASFASTLSTPTQGA
jgi:hypothetical protein